MQAGRKQRRADRYTRGTVPRQPFGFMPGYASATTGKLLFASLSNAPVAVSCAGITYRSGVDFALTAIGTDAPAGHAFNGLQAGYVAVINLAGLGGSCARWPLTVQQGGACLAGTITTTPAAGARFSLYLATCFNNTSLGGISGGWFSHLRAQVLAPGGYGLPYDPCAGVLWIDDVIGYNDFAMIDDRGAGGTGHYVSGADTAQTPRVTNYEYDYALGFLALFGLFGPPDLTGTLTTSEQYLAFGRDSDWLWCCRNLNHRAQLGDHDASGADIGWAIQSSTSAEYAVAGALWDKTIGLITPPAVGVLDAAARHWGDTLGDLRIVAPDGIHNGDAVATAARTLFGNNQIDDVLTAIQSAHQWKLLPMMYSVRDLAATGVQPNRGAQHPIEGITEFQRLFTRTNYGGDPASLMAHASTNGTAGVLICPHGDYHRGLVTENHAPAYANNAAESWYSLHLGTVNGSYNFGLEASIVSGLDYLGKTAVKYVQRPVTGNGAGEAFYHGLRFLIDGPRALEAVHFDQWGAVNWAGRWEPGSNLPV